MWCSSDGTSYYLSVLYLLIYLFSVNTSNSLPKVISMKPWDVFPFYNCLTLYTATQVRNLNVMVVQWFVVCVCFHAPQHACQIYFHCISPNQVTFLSQHPPPSLSNETSQQALTGIEFLTVLVQFSLQSRVNSSMFLRTIGSRLSIQRGALLLRRVPIRAATGAYKVVVEENGGDMSLVGEGLLLHTVVTKRLKTGMSHKRALV